MQQINKKRLLFAGVIIVILIGFEIYNDSSSYFNLRANGRALVELSILLLDILATLLLVFSLKSRWLQILICIIGALSVWMSAVAFDKAINYIPNDMPSMLTLMNVGG